MYIKKRDMVNGAPLDPITGKYLSGGNGCHKFSNCFTCPEPPDKCHYSKSYEREMMKNGLANK
jgi:hypothetical protein